MRPLSIAILTWEKDCGIGVSSFATIALTSPSRSLPPRIRIKPGPLQGLCAQQTNLLFLRQGMLPAKPRLESEGRWDTARRRKRRDKPVGPGVIMP